MKSKILWIVCLFIITAHIIDMNWKRNLLRESVVRIMGAQTQYIGTGFFVHHGLGITLVTNSHVCDEFKKYKVGNHDGTFKNYYSSNIYYVDIKRISYADDLCELSYTKNQKTAFDIRSVTEWESEATTVGFPEYNSMTEKRGDIFSGYTAHVTCEFGNLNCELNRVFEDVGLLRTVTEGGQSGSPVLQNSRVVGVVFARMATVGYFIPKERLIKFLDGNR